MQPYRPILPHNSWRQWHGLFPVEQMEGHMFECICVQRFRTAQGVVTRLWLRTVLPRRQNLGCIIGCDITQYYSFRPYPEEDEEQAHEQDWPDQTDDVEG